VEIQPSDRRDSRSLSSRRLLGAEVVLCPRPCRGAARLAGAWVCSAGQGSVCSRAGWYCRSPPDPHDGGLYTMNHGGYFVESRPSAVTVRSVSPTGGRMAPVGNMAAQRRI